MKDRRKVQVQYGGREVYAEMSDAKSNSRISGEGKEDLSAEEEPMS